MKLRSGTRLPGQNQLHPGSLATRLDTRGVPMVSRVGADAVATVGLTESMLTMSSPAVGLTFVTLAGVLESTFTNEPEVASVASRGLRRIIASGFVFYACGIVVTQSFNGAGDTWTPTIINLLGFWILAVPLAQFLARQLALGPSGVFWSIAAAFSTTAVSTALVFRRGRWKLKRV